MMMKSGGDDGDDDWLLLLPLPRFLQVVDLNVNEDGHWMKDVDQKNLSTLNWGLDLAVCPSSGRAVETFDHLLGFQQ